LAPLSYFYLTNVESSILKLKTYFLTVKTNLSQREDCLPHFKTKLQQHNFNSQPLNTLSNFLMYNIFKWKKHALFRKYWFVIFYKGYTINNLLAFLIFFFNLKTSTTLNPSFCYQIINKICFNAKVTNTKTKCGNHGKKS